MRQALDRIYLMMKIHKPYCFKETKFPKKNNPMCLFTLATHLHLLRHHMNQRYKYTPTEAFSAFTSHEWVVCYKSQWCQWGSLQTAPFLYKNGENSCFCETIHTTPHKNAQKRTKTEVFKTLFKMTIYTTQRFVKTLWISVSTQKRM